MQRRNFLSGLAAIPAVAIAPKLALSSTEKPSESRWLKMLDKGVDWESLYHVTKLDGKPLSLLIDLCGTVSTFHDLDRGLSELSDNRTVELFPKNLWKGSHIISQAAHFAQYLGMRYQYTLKDDNAEVNRAHEGASWSIDERVPDGVILLEAPNGKLGLIRRAFYFRVK